MRRHYPLNMAIPQVTGLLIWDHHPTRYDNWKYHITPPTRTSFCLESMRTWWTKGFGPPPFFGPQMFQFLGLPMGYPIIHVSPAIFSPCAARTMEHWILDRNWPKSTAVWCDRNISQYLPEVQATDRWSQLISPCDRARPAKCPRLLGCCSVTPLLDQIVQPGLSVRSIPDDCTAKNMMSVPSWAWYHH